MKINYRHIIALLAGCLAVLGLTACTAEKSAGHQEAVENANGRWLSARSKLYLQMAHRQFETGDLDQADKSLNEAFSQDPNNPQLYVLAGRIQLERGKLERCFRQLELAIKLDDKLSDAHYYQGVVLQRWQEYDRAYQAYEAAYKIEPDQPAYLLAMGEMLVADGKTDEALALLEPKVTYFDQSAAMRSAVAHLHFMQGNRDKGLTYLKEASTMRPDDMLLAEELAEALAKAGRHSDAVVEYERLVADAAGSNRLDLMHSLGRQYSQAGQSEQAKQVYMQIRRRNPRDAEAWIRLAEFAWMEKDFSATLAASTRAISLAPERYEAHLLAGLVWQQRDNTEQALRLFDRAAQLAPEQTEPLILRGITLQKAGRVDAAADAYHEALRRQPNDHRAKQLLDRLMASAN